MAISHGPLFLLGQLRNDEYQVPIYTLFAYLTSYCMILDQLSDAFSLRSDYFRSTIPLSREVESLEIKIFPARSH